MRVGDVVPKDHSFRKFADGFERLHKLIGSVGDIDFFLAKDVYYGQTICSMIMYQQHGISS